MIGFKHNNTIVFETQLVGFRGAPGFGQSVLNLELRIASHDPKANYRLRLVRITGDVLVGETLLGRTDWTPRTAMHAIDGNPAGQVSLPVPCSDAQVRKLRARVRRGPLKVTGSLRGWLAGAPTGLDFGTACVAAALDDHELRRVVDGMEFSTFKTYEVLLDGPEVPAALVESARLVRDALEHLDGGRWSAAVARCRDALKSMPDLPAPAERTLRHADRVGERTAHVLDALLHASQSGHHADETGEPSVADARLYVRSLVAVWEYVLYRAAFGV